MTRFLFSILLIVVPAIAQEAPSADLSHEATSSKRMNFPSYLEQLFTHYSFNNDGTGRQEIIAKIRILNEMGIQQQSEQVFEYHPLSEEFRIPYIRIRKKDGTLLNIAINSTHVAPSGVTLDSDLDQVKVTIPKLTVGDLLEYDTVTVIRRPLGPGQFYVHHNFQPSGVLDEQLQVDVPRSRTVKVKTVADVEASETGNDVIETYRWRKQNLNWDLDLQRENPWGRTPDVQLSSFQSWEEVGRWCAEIEKNQRVPSPDVKAKADDITRGLPNDLEKVEALYNFTAKKIRYLSLVSFGIGGYIPHSASETLRNEYGDCKDKSVLLEALLEAEGLHASSVLISPDRDLSLDIPSPWPFDHVITVLQVGKEEVWMDPSSAVLPFRMLAYSLRGKQALVLPASTAAHFEQTPLKAPFANMFSEEIDAKVTEDGSLDAAVSIMARGDAELFLRQAFLSPDGSMHTGGVSAVLSDVERNDEITDVKISKPSETNERFILSFRLSRPMFILPWEKQSDVKIPLFGCQPQAATAEGDTGWSQKKSDSMQIVSPGECNYRIRVGFPNQFELKAPPPIALRVGFGSYSASYEIATNVLVVRRTLVIGGDELSLSIGEYKAFMERVLTDSRTKITVANSGKIAKE